MVWFRVDDGWHKHRKRIKVGFDLEGFAARGLWVDAGSWASDELTDGFIPDDVVDYLAPGIGQTLAKRLEAARLWVRAEREGEPGWQFHQWVEQQPTKEEVEASSSRKSSGGKLGNHRRWHVETGKADPKCLYCREDPPSESQEPTDTDRSSDRITDRSSESGPNPPTRPDPTRPVTSSSEEVIGSPSAPDEEDLGDDTTKKGTRIPGDFAVTTKMVAWAVKKCPDVDGRTETEKFIRYWKAKPGKDGLKLSWIRTWQNWMTSTQQRINDRQQGRMAGGLESNAPKAIPANQRCTQHPRFPAATCAPCRSERLVNTKAGAA